MIEWRHLSVGGETCERCGTTGAAVMEAVDDLTFELGKKDIRVLFREVVIDKDRLEESNLITFNGIPLEELIAGDQTETLVQFLFDAHRYGCLLSRCPG